MLNHRFNFMTVKEYAFAGLELGTSYFDIMLNHGLIPKSFGDGPTIIFIISTAYNNILYFSTDKLINFVV